SLLVNICDFSRRDGSMQGASHRLGQVGELRSSHGSAGKDVSVVFVCGPHVLAGFGAAGGHSHGGQDTEDCSFHSLLSNNSDHKLRVGRKPRLWGLARSDGKKPP